MIISRTPLRMSFAGGGSDLETYYKTGHGCVVSSAINKYVYITINKTFDDRIRVSYSKTEIVNHVDEIEHNIIREALKMVGIEKGIEVVYMADIPLGSAGMGLGSSSSLAVGTLNALYAYTGKYASAERLAKEACTIEIEILKNPIGKQDQYITAYGGMNYIQFNKDQTVFVEPIICDNSIKVALYNRLMLFYTGSGRNSADILGEQQSKTPQNIEFLDKMVALSKELKNCLNNNELSRFGEILHEGWLYKTKLASKITNSTINKYYEKAIKAGAIGGKVLGAGGGGFLLFYCKKHKQNKVRAALSEISQSEVNFEPQGSKIIYVCD